MTTTTQTIQSEKFMEITTNKLKEIKTFLNTNQIKFPEHITKKINLIIEKSQNQIYKIAITGQPNAGKSTIISVLLGKDTLLPTNSVACTGFFCEIKPTNTTHNKDKALIHFRTKAEIIQLLNQPNNYHEKIISHLNTHLNTGEDNPEIPPLEIDLSQYDPEEEDNPLEGIITIPETETTATTKPTISPISHVEIFINKESDILNNSTIIDLPGKDNNDTRTKATEDKIKESDLIIYINTPDTFDNSALSTWIKTIKDIRKQSYLFSLPKPKQYNIIHVINKIDTLLQHPIKKQREKQESDFIKKVKECLGDDQYFIISAYNKMNNQEKEEYKFEKFEDYLRSLSCKWRFVRLNEIKNVIDVLRNHVFEYLDMYKVETKDLGLVGLGSFNDFYSKILEGVGDLLFFFYLFTFLFDEFCCYEF